MRRMYKTKFRPALMCACALIALMFGVTGAARLRWPRPTRIRQPELKRLQPAMKTAAEQESRKIVTIETQRVTLRRTGFEPSEFTRHKGPFLLSVDNVSELGEMNFQLFRQNGTTEREIRHRQDKFRLRQVVDLNPGRYVLTEANHPDWRCEITITAQ